MKIIINQGREILLLGSVRESIMKPSETSSGKAVITTWILLDETNDFSKTLSEYSQLPLLYLQIATVERYGCGLGTCR
jgi:hypothetical protein